MPYKDPVKRKAYHARYIREVWYPANRKKHIALTVKSKAKRRAAISIALNRVKCMLCPESHPAALDFHHRDGSEKEFGISQAIANGLSVKLILEEIKKCDVLCANCHRKLHWEEKQIKSVCSSAA